MEWLSLTFLFALVAIAVLVGIVMYLFIRWRTSGQTTVAVSSPENNSKGADTKPLDPTIQEPSKVVGPSPDKQLQESNRTGESAAASMSQEPAHSSNRLPTYGELFPDIVSMKPGNSG
jgi:hypothetical protein